LTDARGDIMVIASFDDEHLRRPAIQKGQRDTACLSTHLLRHSPGFDVLPNRGRTPVNLEVKVEDARSGEYAAKP
jgi:hypothetical protein